MNNRATREEIKQELEILLDLGVISSLLESHLEPLFCFSVRTAAVTVRLTERGRFWHFCAAETTVKGRHCIAKKQLFTDINGLTDAIFNLDQ